ncbi:MAG: MFS transporter [Actinomycetota bacterium]|nr:MFS transporter [Actinomycetota bacterium]
MGTDTPEPPGTTGSSPLEAAMDQTASGRVDDPHQRRNALEWLAHRQLAGYPTPARRYFYLGVVIVASIVLWYQYYVPTSVAPLLLEQLHISFRFYVMVIVGSNLAGVVAALFGGLTDRIGRTWVVIVGLAVVALIQLVVIPQTTTATPFVTELIAVGLFEGMILVATPALVRDFTPQLGRASAMGFWTLGPVAGVLVASLLGSHTIGATSTDWQREFIISGVVGLVVFVVALLFLRELSPRIRDQLMVTRRDRELVELQARGIDTTQATAHPWRQMLKLDVVISAVAVSVLLIIFFTASGFFTVYFDTVFHRGTTYFTLPQANGIDTWIWAADCIGLVVFGIVSDLTRVRKPFMIVGAFGALVMMVVLISLTGRPSTGYYTLVWVTTVLFLFTAMAYATWMASFTETVEARNPALVATGLAIWGAILRLAVAVSLFVLPFVVSSANQVVDNQPYEKYVPRALAIEHRYGPLVAIVRRHQALFTKLASYPNPKLIPTKVLFEGIAAAGGVKNLLEIDAIKPDLTFLQKYQGHLLALQSGAAASPAEWQHWLWVCFAGIAVFIPLVLVMKGRWSPRRARQDERAHEAFVTAELARLRQSGTPPAPRA